MKLVLTENPIGSNLFLNSYIHNAMTSSFYRKIKNTSKRLDLVKRCALELLDTKKIIYCVNSENNEILSFICYESIGDCVIVYYAYTKLKYRSKDLCTTLLDYISKDKVIFKYAYPVELKGRRIWQKFTKTNVYYPTLKS